MKTRTPLEIAVEEKEGLEHRLAEAHESAVELQRELDDLWDKRLTPGALTDGSERQRTIEIRQALSDEREIIVALREKIAERSQAIRALQREKNRDEAAVACQQAEAEFQSLIAALEDHLPSLDGWLLTAHEAHRKYAAANPGDAPRGLVTKIQVVTELYTRIKHGRTQA